jgi:predicted alpha/beta superfamily hydrolase
MYRRPATVRVWLPPGYGDANATAKYPTLYFLDGQTVFDECTAFKGEHELQVDETVTRLIDGHKIQPIIVVGIDSSDKRAYEYAPYKAPSRMCGRQSPSASSFLPSSQMRLCPLFHRVTE